MPTFSPPQIASYSSTPVGPKMLLLVRTDTGVARNVWHDDNAGPRAEDQPNRGTGGISFISTRPIRRKTEPGMIG